MLTSVVNSVRLAEIKSELIVRISRRFVTCKEKYGWKIRAGESQTGELLLSL